MPWQETCTGKTTEIDENFSFVDCDLALSLDREGNIRLDEVSEKGDQMSHLEGTYVIDGALITTNREPAAGEVYRPYVSIKTDGNTMLVYETDVRAEFDDPEYSVLYNECSLDGTTVYTVNEFNFAGITRTEKSFCFDSLSSPAEMIRTEIRSELTEDGAYVIEREERSVRADISELEKATPDDIAMSFKFSDKEGLSDIYSFWYSYDGQSDGLTIFWAGENVVLSRN